MILIDIDMPKKCGLCPLFHAEFPMHCKLIKPPDKNKRIVTPYGLPRPEWCPLKEQEAKTGKWILDDEDANSWECSECGGLLLVNEGTPHENDWYFCPYCGSELEGPDVKWE